MFRTSPTPRRSFRSAKIWASGIGRSWSGSPSTHRESLHRESRCNCPHWPTRGEEIAVMVRLGRLLALGAALLMLAGCAGVSGFPDAGKQTTIETRPGVHIKLVQVKAHNPSALVIMLPGGDGQLHPDLPGTSGGFLSRSLVAQGLSVAEMGPPSDHERGLSPRFRETPAHLHDLEAVIAHYRKSTRLPIWLWGISRSTLSVLYAAAYASERPDGFIVLSSVAGFRREQSTHRSCPCRSGGCASRSMPPVPPWTPVPVRLPEAQPALSPLPSTRRARNPGFHRRLQHRPEPVRRENRPYVRRHSGNRRCRHCPIRQGVGHYSDGDIAFWRILNEHTQRAFANSSASRASPDLQGDAVNGGRKIRNHVRVC